MLVAISRMVSEHDSTWLSPDYSYRKRLFCLSLLMPAITICLAQFAIAQQSEVSILVTEDSTTSAASNAQVELPQPSSSKPSFNPIPVSTQPFAVPLPPSTMVEDLENAARFRSSTQNTLIAAASPGRAEQASVLTESTTLRNKSTVNGTFTARSPTESGLQQEGSFGSSRASSDLRFNHASSGETRNRFGDFGASPNSNAASRFAPISSSQNSQRLRDETPTKPLAQPARNHFTPPVVVPATAEQPIRTPAPATGNQLSTPSPPQTSNRFAPPSSQSLLSPINRPQPSTTSEKFASPVSSRSTLQNSLGAPSQLPSSGFNSRSAGDRGKSASPPMIRRQASSSSAQSFSNSLRNGQSSQAGPGLSSQTNRFGSQPTRQPLRGRPIENETRNATSNGQAPVGQRFSNVDRSSDKVDRSSIDFAKQQLRRIQAASVGESGTPVRLIEMFLEPVSGSQRKQMVTQYWETYYDLAALKIATSYEDWLNSISTSTRAETGLLSAAQQMAADGQLAAKIQLGKSQSRLLDFMPNPRPNGFAPLPADEPLVERYVTDYEKYKRVRSLPSSLRGIDPMLASTLKLITHRAATVSAAKNAVDQAGQALRNRQIPLASAIAAGRIWRDSQLDMIASTVSYNQAISDFVLTLESNRSPEQLTAFMLGAPKSDSQSSAARSRTQPTRSAVHPQSWPQSQHQIR